ALELLDALDPETEKLLEGSGIDPMPFLDGFGADELLKHVGPSLTYPSFATTLRSAGKRFEGLRKPPPGRTGSKMRQDGGAGHPPARGRRLAAGGTGFQDFFREQNRRSRHLARRARRPTPKRVRA